MGGRTNRTVASMLVINPVAFRDTRAWANFALSAHVEKAQRLGQCFTVEERSTANLIARRGNIVLSASDLSYVAQDLLPTICTHVVPHLVTRSGIRPRGCKVHRGMHPEARRMARLFSPSLVNLRLYQAQTFNPLRPRQRLDPVLRYTPWPDGFSSHCESHHEENNRSTMPR
jgi:hypothetical protein